MSLPGLAQSPKMRMGLKRRLAPVLCPLLGGNLPALARYFWTDKQGPHEFGHHRYTEQYPLHFAARRMRRLRILEIGVGGYDDPTDGGASLRMWKYYFPRSEIVGLDIEDKRHFAERRVRVYQGDQTDPEILTRIVSDLGGIDIVIDDGSHVSEHIIRTFGILFPLLAPDGLYCIEDLLTAYLPEYGGGPEAADTSVRFIHRLSEGLQYADFKAPDEISYTDRHIEAVHLYHNLAIIQKGLNTDGGVTVPAD